VNCEFCDRTSKIPIHERISVRGRLRNERLVMFEKNDPAMVRQLAMDASLASRAGYRLDWSGTWGTGKPTLPFLRNSRVADSAPLEVVIRFELPAPIRVEEATDGRARLDSIRRQRAMVDSGAYPPAPWPSTRGAREDFTLFVITTPSVVTRRDLQSVGSAV